MVKLTSIVACALLGASMASVVPQQAVRFITAFGDGEGQAKSAGEGSGGRYGKVDSDTYSEGDGYGDAIVTNGFPRTTGGATSKTKAIQFAEGPWDAYALSGSIQGGEGKAGFRTPHEAAAVDGYYGGGSVGGGEADGRGQAYGKSASKGFTDNYADANARKTRAGGVSYSGGKGVGEAVGDDSAMGAGGSVVEAETNALASNNRNHRAGSVNTAHGGGLGEGGSDGRTTSSVAKGGGGGSSKLQLNGPGNAAGFSRGSGEAEATGYKNRYTHEGYGAGKGTALTGGEGNVLTP